MSRSASWSVNFILHPNLSWIFLLERRLIIFVSWHNQKLLLVLINSNPWDCNDINQYKTKSIFIVSEIVQYFFERIKVLIGLRGWRFIGILYSSVSFQAMSERMHHWKSTIVNSFNVIFARMNHFKSGGALWSSFLSLNTGFSLSAMTLTVTVMSIWIKVLITRSLKNYKLTLWSQFCLNHCFFHFQDVPAGWIIEKDDSNEDVFVNSLNDEKVC